MDILIAILLLALYASFAITLIYLAVKKTWLFILLLGAFATVAALPVGYLVEINIDDWYSRPNGEVQGIGYAVAALMGIVGFSLIFISRKLKKKTLQK